MQLKHHFVAYAMLFCIAIAIPPFLYLLAASDRMFLKHAFPFRSQKRARKCFVRAIGQVPNGLLFRNYVFMVFLAL